MMNEEMKTTTENVEETSKESVEAQVNEEKADATMATENETLVQSKEEGVIDKVLDIWERVKLCCYFVPIITTVAIFMGSAFETIEWLNYIFIPLCFVGWAAAILTGPFRLIKLIWKWISFGWKAFWIIPVYPICLILGCIGAVLCFAVIGEILLFAPAVVTIYYFIAEEQG